MCQKISKKMYPVYWRPWAAHHCWRKEHESPSRRAPAKLATINGREKSLIIYMTEKNKQ